MKVDIFTLCDSAQEYGGKLIIIGTFNSIYGKEFPTLHPEFALVARVVFGEDEKGVHNIDLWKYVGAVRNRAAPFFAGYEKSCDTGIFRMFPRAGSPDFLRQA